MVFDWVTDRGNDVKDLPMKTSPSVVMMLVRLAAAVAIAVLSACGGGGGSSAPPTNNPAPTKGTISGTAVKGPVANATVTAYGISNGTLGAPVGSATTNSQGNFSVPIGSYSGPVMLQMMGGTYTDEATGTMMTMRAGDVMTAVMQTLAAGSTISGIQLTPLTAMAQTMAAHMTGGMTDANISAANTNVGHYFMVSDILHTMPMNPLVSGSGSGSEDSINYGMTLAAMSEFAKSVGMSSSSAMVTAMMNDAADGDLDGRMFGSPVMMGGMGMSVAMPSTAGTTGLGAAMLAFMNSVENKSGVTTATVESLLSFLNGSSGSMMGSGSGSGSGSTVDGMLRGTAFYGPMNQGTVTAYAVTGGVKGAQIASAAIGAQGTFSLSIGHYSGPVMLQVTGAVFTDEATDTSMTMASSDTMTAVVPAVAIGSTTSGIWITPLSSMAQTFAQGMSGGMTDTNIDAANTSVGAYFLVSDILHSSPMNPLVSGAATGSTQDQENCGIAIAAMSEYAKTLGMSVSSAFVTAVMSDASDGMMDGNAGSSQISMGGGMMMGSGNMMQSDAATSGLASAMTTYLGSSANVSGLNATTMNALIQQLAASNGQL
jgi:hypothetical protein